MFSRLFLLFFLILQLSCIAQQVIPNYSFEIWENNEPQDWVTSNIQADSIFNVYKVNPGVSGEFAIGGSVLANPKNIDIPLIPILESNTSNFGFDISEEYPFLSFYYTFFPRSEDDFLSVSVSVLDDNGSVYGSGIGIISAESPVFSPFEIPIEY